VEIALGRERDAVLADEPEEFLLVRVERNPRDLP
jgi:hypothetical protein